MVTRFCIYYLGLTLLNVLTDPVLSQTIQCLGKQSCKNTKLTCESGKSCTLICDGGNQGQACQHAELDASQASDLTIYCINVQDCINMDIICGDGDCNVQCQQSLSCKQLDLFCGTSDCELQCQVDTSCDKINVDSTFASSFHCINHREYCPYDLLQFGSTQTPIIKTTTISTSEYTQITQYIMSSIPTTTPNIESSSALIDSTNIESSTIAPLITDEDLITDSFPAQKQSTNWIGLLYIAIATAVICFVMICCIYKVYKYCGRDEGKVNAKENDDWIVEMKDGDATPGVTTTLKPTTTGTDGEGVYREGESDDGAVHTNCMEKSVLIDNEMSAMGISCTVDGDHCIDTSKMTRSRNATLEHILHDIMDDNNEIGTVTPLFGATLNTRKTNVLTVGEVDDDSVHIHTQFHSAADSNSYPHHHPTLCLNESATIHLPKTHIELNQSESMIHRIKDVDSSINCGLKCVIYDFDETITRIHLYKELIGGGVDALQWVSVPRLIEIFGGLQRIQRLKKHFSLLTCRSIQIGVLSFGFEQVIINALHRIDLLYYFTFIVGRDSFALKKVKGDKGEFIANFVLDKKYDKKQVLFVDDDEHNIDSAIKKDCCRTLLIKQRKGMNESHLQRIEAHL